MNASQALQKVSPSLWQRWSKALVGFAVVLAVSLAGCGLEVLLVGLPSGGNPQPPDGGTTPASGWWNDAVVYQIFVRSFQDSNGDGIGDLKGLTQRLDYLNDGDPQTDQDLGVDAIWLLPIFASPSYHGYDCTDYEEIKKEYGTLDDLKELLVQAHRRGIRVLLDLVLNHTSRRHPWFVQSSSPDSTYRSWYVWRKENPRWTQPWGSQAVWHGLGGFYYYGLFSPGMPDLNLRHGPVKEELFRLTRHWLALGVDGFRLDAARYLLAEGKGGLQSDQPATHDFWREYRQVVKEASPQALLAGEVWSDTPTILPYCQGDQFDLAFHFPLALALLEDLNGEQVRQLRRILVASQKLPPSCWAPFLSNHDQRRSASELRNNPQRMRLAAILLLTLPGTPFLYYGEEIGLPNGPGRDDKDKRTPMAWDDSPHGDFTSGKQPWFPLSQHKEANVATQSQDPLSLLSLYRKLIRLRRQHKALRQGKWQLLQTEGDPHKTSLALLRGSPPQQILIVANFSTQQAQLTLSLPFSPQKGSTLLQEGSPQLSLPPPPAKNPASTPALLKVTLPPTSALITQLSHPSR